MRRYAPSGLELRNLVGGAGNPLSLSLMAHFLFSQSHGQTPCFFIWPDPVYPVYETITAFKPGQLAGQSVGFLGS